MSPTARTVELLAILAWEGDLVVRALSALVVGAFASVGLLANAWEFLRG